MGTISYFFTLTTAIKKECIVIQLYNYDWQFYMWMQLVIYYFFKPNTNKMHTFFLLRMVKYVGAISYAIMRHGFYERSFRIRANSNQI